MEYFWMPATFETSDTTVTLTGKRFKVQIALNKAAAESALREYARESGTSRAAEAAIVQSFATVIVRHD